LWSANERGPHALALPVPAGQRRASPPRSQTRRRRAAQRVAASASTVGTLLVSLAFVAGCTDVTRPAPKPPRVAVAPITPALPPPPPNSPADARRHLTGRLYQRVSPLSYGTSDAYWLSSSGGNGTFQMILPDGLSLWPWTGRYTRADSVLVFRYNAWSAAGELTARGIVRGDTLLLEYNTIMMLMGFEDGVYVRPRRPW
jgi:hypothetical protein